MERDHWVPLIKTNQKKKLVLLSCYNPVLHFKTRARCYLWRQNPIIRRARLQEPATSGVKCASCFTNEQQLPPMTFRHHNRYYGLAYCLLQVSFFGIFFFLSPQSKPHSILRVAKLPPNTITHNAFSVFSNQQTFA